MPFYYKEELDSDWKRRFSTGKRLSVIANYQRVFNYNTQEKATSFEAHPEYLPCELH